MLVEAMIAVKIGASTAAPARRAAVGVTHAEKATALLEKNREEEVRGPGVKEVANVLIGGNPEKNLDALNLLLNRCYKDGS
jgi:hypothetical protein